MKRIKAMSMFSGGGIAETYFKEIGVDVLVANELLPERAQFYSENHPNTKMICGDITEETIGEDKIKLIRWTLDSQKDVLLDTLGASAGILIVYVAMRWLCLKLKRITTRAKCSF